MTPEVKSLVSLGYKIKDGDFDGVKDVMRHEPKYLLNETDYAGNTPLVSQTSLIPLGCPSR